MADPDYYYVEPITQHRVTLVRGDGSIVRTEDFDQDDSAVRYGEEWVRRVQNEKEWMAAKLPKIE